MKFTRTIVAALATTVLLSNLASVSYAQQSSTSLSSETITQVETASTVPLIVANFLDTLISDSGRDALVIWAESMNVEEMLKQRPEFFISMTNDPTTRLTPREATELLDNMVNMMGDMVDTFAGKCSGYTVLDSLPLGEKTQIIYAVSEHEERPFFWNFTVYKPEDHTIWNIPVDGWVITEFNFNTQASGIIPPSVIYRWISKSE